MILIDLCFAIILLSTLTINVEYKNTTSACEDGWIEVPPYGCFLFYSDEFMTWLDAQAFCQANGGYLAEITTEELQQSLSLIAKVIGES